MKLDPSIICPYSKLCPTSRDCWGKNPERKWEFQCDFIVILGINIEFWVPKACYDK